MYLRYKKDEIFAHNKIVHVTHPDHWFNVSSVFTQTQAHTLYAITISMNVNQPKMNGINGIDASN